MLQCTIHRLGELALLCEVPPPATLDCQQRIWAMASRASHWAGVIDVVPGMNNLTIVFGPQADAPHHLPVVRVQMQHLSESHRVAGDWDWAPLI